MAKTLESPDLYTIGWIVALPIERAAATAMLDERHGTPDGFEQHPNDSNSYTWGRVDKHNIVIASLPAGIYGLVAASNTVSRLLSSLPDIRIGLLVGIGGGIPRHGPRGDVLDIRLGDIAVSQPSKTEGGVIQYDLGKLGPDDKWERVGSLDKPPQVLLNALTNLQAEHEMSPSRVPEFLKQMWVKFPMMAKSQDGQPAYIHQGSTYKDRLFKSAYDHNSTSGANCSLCESKFEVFRRDRPSDNPKIFYGTIASGNTLNKEPYSRDDIVEKAGQQCICFEMEAAGLMDSFPCLVIRGICDYSDSHKNDQWQRYAAATAAAYAKELLGFVPVRELRGIRRAVDVVGSIENLKEEVQDLKVTTNHESLKRSLASLPVVLEACFDSEQESNKSFCLENTRVDVLNELMQWAKNPDSKSVYWLCGMAGTGKSTISRSLASRLNEIGRLGASFFFKRNERDRDVSAKLFTTIAFQLAEKRSTFASKIKKILDASPSIGTKSIKQQFEELILDPLSDLVSTNSTPIPSIIVLDALDECELGEKANEQARLVIGLLARTKNLGLKVFVTSRPELPFRLGFASIKDQYQDTILHELPKTVVRQDISTFLRHEFKRIYMDYVSSLQGADWPSTWPSTSQLERLVNIAVPLFIVAATICRFVEHSGDGSPREKLEDFLQNLKADGDSPLDDTYTSVLQKLIQNAGSTSKQKVLRRFRDVVGSIVLLATPLSTASLSYIIHISRDSIEDQLRKLHSVLNVPSNSSEPVRLLHLSFRDFLVDPEKENEEEKYPFFINEREGHGKIATGCLQLLVEKEHLRKDICDLKHPGTQRYNIDHKAIESGLPPEIQYACRYWVFHQTESGRMINDDDLVYTFLQKHFLHWLEVLALLGEIRESLPMVESLLTLLHENNSNGVSIFLHDARRVIMQNSTTLHEWPLQIYHSALVFAPEKSVIRKAFQHEFPDWLALRPQVDDDWDARLRTLEGHDNGISSLAFSPDSGLLASASDDSTIKLWNFRTGECIATLSGHIGGVKCVIFLSGVGCGRLASGSWDRTIKIWDVVNGDWDCVSTLRGHDEVRSIVYLPGSRPTIASVCRRGNIRCWDLQTKECISIVEGHPEDTISLTAMPDSGRLISASKRDGKVMLWDAAYQDRTEIFCHEGVDAVAVSPNSEIIASTDSRSIHLWDAMTNECTATFELAFEDEDDDEDDKISSIAFLSNSGLALGSEYGTMRLWDTRKHNCAAKVSLANAGVIAAFPGSHDAGLLASAPYYKIILWDPALAVSASGVQEGLMDEIWSVTIAPDGTLIASTTYKGEIQLWDASTGKLSKRLLGHEERVNKVCFWPGSETVTSASDDKTIRLWDTKMGDCTQVLKGHNRGVTFLRLSPDAKTLASGSWDETVKLWDLSSGTCVATLKADSQRPAVAFSPDSDLFALVDRLRIQIWRVPSCECIRDIPKKYSDVTTLAFSPDSKTLVSVSGSDRDRLDVWDVATGECLCKIHFDFGARVDYLEFDLSGTSLCTNFGKFTFRDPSSSTPVPPTRATQLVREGIGISNDRMWITWNDDNILWLPPKYRPRPLLSIISDVKGPIIVFGAENKRMLMVRVNESVLSHLKPLPPPLEWATDSDIDRGKSQSEGSDSDETGSSSSFNS